MKKRIRRYDFELIIGGGIVTMLLVFSIFGLLHTPYSPTSQDIPARLEGPSYSHWLGTDHLGRDMLSRLMKGATNSLFVSLLAVAVGSITGTALGMLAGYFNRWIDDLIMRVVDFIMGFPIILFAIMIVSILGPGILNIVIAIGVANIPVFARLVRGNLLTLRERDFVTAARASGAGTTRILVAHLLPNLASPLLIQFTIAVGTAILADSALSYLGLGIQPPHPSWGRMITEAQLFLRIDPWLAILPGSFLALSVLGFNLLGDRLRDVLDPQDRYRFR